MLCSAACARRRRAMLLHFMWLCTHAVASCLPCTDAAPWPMHTDMLSLHLAVSHALGRTFPSRPAQPPSRPPEGTPWARTPGRGRSLPSATARSGPCPASQLPARPRPQDLRAQAWTMSHGRAAAPIAPTLLDACKPCMYTHRAPSYIDVRCISAASEHTLPATTGMQHDRDAMLPPPAVTVGCEVRAFSGSSATKAPPAKSARSKCFFM